MTLFSTWATPATSGILPRTYANRAADVINVDEFYPANAGAVHNNASHPLSGYFANLAAAQVVYPFATSLTQQVDYCACKLASNTAFGADGSEHAGTNASLNKRIRIPAGTYVFGNDTWLIRNLVGGIIHGDGRLSTVLTGNGVVMGFDGLWYSEIAYLTIGVQTTGAATGLDIDGNVPGQPYTTRGVQGNTLRNLYIDGGNSSQAFSMCRLGGSSAQGSENLYLNVHVNNASFACYYQNGFNALANTFVGGNFQTYPQNGIYVTGGTIAVINTGFQSTTGYHQIENGGYDINVGSAGAGEACIIYGCRTESLRFFNNDDSVIADIRGCAQNGALAGWVALTAYGPVAAAYKAIVEGGNLYVATTPGTSGSVKPTFSIAASPITDASVVWTYTQFDVIRNLTGSLARQNLKITAGSINAPAMNSVTAVNADTTLDWSADCVVCDTTAGNIAITLPTVGVSGADRGWQITVKKSVTANAVTINGPMEDGTTSMTLAAATRGSVTLMYADRLFGSTRSWLIIARVA